MWKVWCILGGGTPAEEGKPAAAHIPAAAAAAAALWCAASSSFSCRPLGGQAASARFTRALAFLLAAGALRIMGAASAAVAGAAAGTAGRDTGRGAGAMKGAGRTDGGGGDGEGSGGGALRAMASMDAWLGRSTSAGLRDATTLSNSVAASVVAAASEETTGMGMAVAKGLMRRGPEAAPAVDPPRARFRPAGEAASSTDPGPDPEGSSSASAPASASASSPHSSSSSSPLQLASEEEAGEASARDGRIWRKVLTTRWDSGRLVKCLMGRGKVGGN